MLKMVLKQFYLFHIDGREDDVWSENPRPDPGQPVLIKEQGEVSASLEGDMEELVEVGARQAENELSQAEGSFGVVGKVLSTLELGVRSVHIFAD